MKYKIIFVIATIMVGFIHTIKTTPLQFWTHPGQLPSVTTNVYSDRSGCKDIRNLYLKHNITQPFKLVRSDRCVYLFENAGCIGKWDIKIPGIPFETTTSLLKEGNGTLATDFYKIQTVRSCHKTFEDQPLNSSLASINVTALENNSTYHYTWVNVCGCTNMVEFELTRRQKNAEFFVKTYGRCLNVYEERNCQESYITILDGNSEVISFDHDDDTIKSKYYSFKPCEAPRHCPRFDVTITEVNFNFPKNLDETHVEEIPQKLRFKQEELQNNEDVPKTSNLIQTYPFENKYEIHYPEDLNRMEKVTFDDNVKINNSFGLGAFDDETWKRQFFKLHMLPAASNWATPVDSYYNIRDHNFELSVSIPSVSRIDISCLIHYIKSYRVDYIMTMRVTGKWGIYESMSTDEIKQFLFENQEFDNVINNTVIVKTRSFLYLDFGTGTACNITNSPI